MGQQTGAVAVDMESGVAGFLQPGNYVDVIVTIDFLRFHTEHIGRNLVGERIADMDIDRPRNTAGKTDGAHNAMARRIIRVFPFSQVH